jgi:hypothetical protein
MTKTKIALFAIPVLAAVMVVSSFAPAFAGGPPCGNCIYGTSGNDRLQGGDGPQFIFGFSGNDKISAGDGNDTVYPGDGIDRVTLGDGDDYIYLDNDMSKDRILCGDGDDTVFYDGALDPEDTFKDCENFIDNQ